MTFGNLFATVSDTHLDWRYSILPIDEGLFCVLESDQDREDFRLRPMLLTDAQTIVKARIEALTEFYKLEEIADRLLSGQKITIETYQDMMASATKLRGNAPQ